VLMKLQTTSRVIAAVVVEEVVDMGEVGI